MDWTDRLRGKPGKNANQDPILLSSSLDALGLTFAPALQNAAWEEMAEVVERQNRRALLAEYLGVRLPGRNSTLPADLGAELLAEKDWMLPEYGAVYFLRGEDKDLEQINFEIMIIYNIIGGLSSQTTSIFSE